MKEEDRWLDDMYLQAIYFQFGTIADEIKIWKKRIASVFQFHNSCIVYYKSLTDTIYHLHVCVHNGEKIQHRHYVFRTILHAVQNLGGILSGFVGGLDLENCATKFNST